MPTQSELIGHHPDNTNIFGTWLTCTDVPVTQTKNHRSLIAINQTHDQNLIVSPRPYPIEVVSRYVVAAHQSGYQDVLADVLAHPPNTHTGQDHSI